MPYYKGLPFITQGIQGNPWKTFYYKGKPFITKENPLLQTKTPYYKGKPPITKENRLLQRIIFITKDYFYYKGYMGRYKNIYIGIYKNTLE